MFWAIASTRSECGEDVVLLGHDRMASEAAVDDSGLVGREGVGCGLIVEDCISPPLRVRESLAVLFDEENVLEGIRYPHRKRRLRALLRFPFDLHDLGSVREGL